MFVIWIESGDSVRDEYTEVLLETTEHTKMRLEMEHTEILSEMDTQRFCQRWTHRDSVRDGNTEILLETEHTEIPLETEHTELSCSNRANCHGRNVILKANLRGAPFPQPLEFLLKGGTLLGIFHWRPALLSVINPHKCMLERKLGHLKLGSQAKNQTSMLR